MTLTQEQAADLLIPFPPEAIHQKPKKNNRTGEVSYLDYVGHAEVTERLSQVDPAWVWEPFAVADDGGPLIRYSDDGKTAELWISLTIGGTTRPGVGTVSTEAWSGEVAKELVSDALRNAAMRFGVALHLWKRHTTETVPQQDRQPYSGAPQNTPPGRTIPLASGADTSGPMTTGPKSQSSNLYRLWHHVLHLDKVEYYEQILIATGLEIEDDRQLTKNEAKKVISHLMKMAGEEEKEWSPTPQGQYGQQVVDEAPPLEDPQDGFDFSEEPF